MRCALKFDEDKNLSEQMLSAWGEMQSLKEDPAYKEENIKDGKDRGFMEGYKAALDDVFNNLENNMDAFMDIDESNTLGKIRKEIVEEVTAALSELAAGELAMQLFSILDNQEE